MALSITASQPRFPRAARQAKLIVVPPRQPGCSSRNRAAASCRKKRMGIRSGSAVRAVIACAPYRRRTSSGETYKHLTFDDPGDISAAAGGLVSKGSHGPGRIFGYLQASYSTWVTCGTPRRGDIRSAGDLVLNRRPPRIPPFNLTYLFLSAASKSMPEGSKSSCARKPQPLSGRRAVHAVVLPPTDKGP